MFIEVECPDRTKGRGSFMRKLLRIVCIGQIFMLAVIINTGQAAEGNKKVAICHEGITIRVAKPAVSAHLGHGDIQGACSEEPQETIEDEENEKFNAEDGKRKIILCHKGRKNISVAKHAVSAHLRHGDKKGACP